MERGELTTPHIPEDHCVSGASRASNRAGIKIDSPVPVESPSSIDRALLDRRGAESRLTSLVCQSAPAACHNKS
jgi:hypothetical protein